MADEIQQGEFLIQVEQDEGGARLEFGGSNVIKGSDKKLEAVSDLAQKAADKLGHLFSGAGPDSGSVEFALTFEASTGAPVLAKGSIGASITVTLNWEKG